MMQCDHPLLLQRNKDVTGSLETLYCDYENALCENHHPIIAIQPVFVSHSADVYDCRDSRIYDSIDFLFTKKNSWA